MAILKLYGAPGKLPTCTRRVATVLHELKIPFELIEVDIMAGETKSPTFLKNQPFGQIPYIDDDGFILYETRAICRYLAAKHPASGLIPTEPQANALFEQAAAAEVTGFEPIAVKAWSELAKPIIFGKVSDQAVIDSALENLDKKLTAYDVILSKQRFVAGDILTLADLFHLPLAFHIGFGGSDIMTRKPNVARWYKELTTRPSWLAYEAGVKSTTEY